MLPHLVFYLALVNDVRALIARHDFAAAERQARAYQTQAGSTPELAAAYSWLARAALDARRLDEAEAYAAETRKVADPALASRPLDSDPWLPTAVGAAIEVHASVLSARGDRAGAVDYLRGQLNAFGSTSIAERIRKNLNLLTIERKTAPALEVREWIGSPRPAPLASLKGHPVLLFFWAHWCGDCKGEAPILAEAQRTFGSKGLLVVAPTKLYGYAAGGEDAAPAVEKQYIARIRQQYYPMLADTPVPLSAANFMTYGVSTTPTLVLLDRAGVVRFYHPGAIGKEELFARIQAVLRLRSSIRLTRNRSYASND
ncbi:MAG TPA: redoxin family protein [Bryobacteraceae bacterium]|jgi:thiol-disulfide isomerase/thioredoxin